MPPATVPSRGNTARRRATAEGMGVGEGTTVRSAQGNRGAAGSYPFAERSSPVRDAMKLARRSIGSGKMMVEFFSVPISVRVWR